MISLRGVEQSFGATRVLEGVDLEVGAGERVVICGDNGAGKTTLVRVIAGLLRPSVGEVRVLGGTPADARVRRRVGLLGHAPFLYSRLTALENLRFWGRMYDVEHAARNGALLLERLGLDPADSRHVGDYSQGMRRRVGLARALVHDPDVLLLDEPFAGLDAAGVAGAEALIDERPRAEKPRTVVLTTHRADGPALRLEKGRLG